MVKPSEKPLTHRLGMKITNGAIAGIVGTSIVFPLDLAKTRLQSQSNSSLKGATAEREYKNIFNVFSKVVKSSGYRGLYKGLGINLFFVMPEKAIKLSVNDQSRSMLGSRSGEFLSVEKEIFAGGLAGLCQVIVTTPMEFLKIQMQMSTNRLSSTSKSTGAFRLAFGLLRRNGIPALYKGVSATLCRDVWFSTLYFPSFAYLNSKGISLDSSKPAFYHTFSCGLVAGAFAAFMATPFDVIKTRLQVIKLTSNEQTYNGFKDCLLKTIKNDGIKALFIGSLIRMSVIAPLFGIAQAVYFLGISERLFALLE